MPVEPFSLLSRRAFCSTTTAALLVTARLWPQAPPLYGSVRPDVAAIDHDRILAAAGRALAAKPVPLTSLVEANSPGTPHDFYSEKETVPSNPAAFTAHQDALLTLSRQVAALAAAFQITHEDRYAAQAMVLLRAWFLESATRMTPTLLYGQMAPAVGKAERKSSSDGVIETVFLAEVAQAISVLAASKAVAAEDLAGVKGWFASYLQWLTESRLAGLARDQKDHHASSWLLQAAAYARLTGHDAALAELRHRFKTVTLRAQIVADGTFPHELATAYPYRNSMFNLDMLTAACELLSSRFENLWEVELQDGPGMHIAIAKYFPYMLNRRMWPYRADLTHFDDLPVRNPSLLFAARAYTRPEYAELWKTLEPDPAVLEIERTFPISQPLLWINHPRL